VTYIDKLDTVKKPTNLILLFHRAFQFTICNGPTNALVCNKTLIQILHIKTLKNHSNMFRSSADHHQGVFDPG
jgi:hypothetical protein